MNGKLYVVAVISNPARYHSRYRLYHDFAARVARAGAHLVTVELALGDRPFRIPEAIHFRTWSELWHKENLINVGIANLPHDWEYVAWLDADIEILRPDWVEETIQQLQHYHFVQMFSHAVDMGPNKDVLQVHKGFVWSWRHHQPHGKGYEHWHPGFGWACRREAYEFVRKLIDLAVLGSADRHMAGALIGAVSSTYNSRVHKNYKSMCMEWQSLCTKYIAHDIGYIPGTLIHHWHGKKRDRRYVDRWKILVENNFDPFVDVRYSPDGILELTERNSKLRDDLRHYFHSRNEDSIDL